MKMTPCVAALVIWGAGGSVARADVFSTQSVSAPQAQAAQETPAKPFLSFDTPYEGLLPKGILFLPYRIHGLSYAKDLSTTQEAVDGTGHLHVRLDAHAWGWIHASPGPIVLMGLSKGRHTVHVILANSRHMPVDTQEFSFKVP